MTFKLTPKFKQKINPLALIPLALLSAAFFIFANRFQSLPKISNDPQVISEPKNKKEIVLEESEVLENTIVWGESEVWTIDKNLTENWKTFNAKDLGISLKYPSEKWYPKQLGYDWSLQILITSPTDVSSPQNFYIGQDLAVSISNWSQIMERSSMADKFTIPDNISEYSPKDFFEFYKSLNKYPNDVSWLAKEVTIQDFGNVVYVTDGSKSGHLFFKNGSDWYTLFFGLSPLLKEKSGSYKDYLDTIKNMVSTIKAL